MQRKILLTVLITQRCWDGKSLDSPDHQSHMYNTVTSEGFTNAPACPATHPVRVPQVTFEIEWDTTVFNSLWDPAKDKNPFVWSFEGTGAGTHADYLFGLVPFVSFFSPCIYDEVIDG